MEKSVLLRTWSSKKATIKMSKSSVIGKNANPVYQYLYDKTGKAPMWNFYKYVVMPGASDIHVFSSVTQPDSDKILGLLKPYISD